MIDVLVYGESGAKKLLELPIPLRKLEKLREELGEAGWHWDIRHMETDCGFEGITSVLNGNNLPDIPYSSDDIREINLLSYLLSRMDEGQLDNLNADIYDYGISTFELVCRAYYHADEYFSDGVTEDNEPVSYCDYECSYHGENVEEMLRQEEKALRHREKLQKQHEEASEQGVAMGGM